MTVTYYDKNNNKLTLGELKGKVIEDNTQWTQALSAVFKRLEKEGVIVPRENIDRVPLEKKAV